MKWYPDTMILADVIRPHGGLKGAGLKKIGRNSGILILTFTDETVHVVAPGEEIPLPKEGD